MNVVVNGAAKRESTTEKLLGLQIDQNIGWKSHFYGSEENLLKQVSSGHAEETEKVPP